MTTYVNTGSRPCRAGTFLRALAATIVALTGATTVAWAGDAPTSAPPLSSATTLTASEPLAGDACESSPAPFFSSPMLARGGADAGPGDPSPLWVTCALPYATGKPGGDCTGKHTLVYSANKPGATLTAELMGLDQNGSLIKAFTVSNGVGIHLASRLSSADWRIAESNKGEYTVFAPVPLVKVTAEYDGDTAVAYCSNIPWVDVLQPSGGAVTDNGDGETETKVLAAIPRTNSADLHLYFDGVDLLAPGVITPALPAPLTSCTPDSPCEGIATVNGNMVQVTDLIVDVANLIESPSSNTIRATLNNLSCGQHFVRVETTKAVGSLKDPTAEACLVDDLADAATSSVFLVTISNPTPQMVTSAVPTPVQGEICGGTAIINANINGLTLDVSGQTFTPGNGVSQGDLYHYVIDTALQQTNLRADFDGATTALGTFTAGSNRLVASATESGGVRAYRRLIFAVGDNIKPLGVDPGAVIIQQEAIQQAFSANLQSAVESKLMNVMSATETEIKNAFIVGISAQGANTIMNNLCTKPLPGDTRSIGQIFKETVEDVLDNFTQSNPLAQFEFDPFCSCSTDVKVWIDSVTASSDFQCPITFENDKMTVSLQLPDVTVTLKAHGPEEDCAIVVPPFYSTTEVNATATIRLEDIHFDYTITEGDILNNTTTVGAEPFKIDGTVELSASGGPEYGVAGDICNFLVDAFVTVLTFGQVDIGPLLYLQVDITEEIDLQETLKPAQPGAIPMKAIYIEEQTVDPYHQKMSGEISLVSDIQITPDGITAGLKGSFATTKVDLGVESNPGIEVKEPPLPTMGALSAQGAKDALVGLSEDAINMMFASLAGGGDMKVAGSDAQGCFSTGATLGSLLPENCDSIDLGVGAELATAGARGYCHAIKQANCDAIVYPDPDPTGIDFTALLSGTARGVCHGASGHVCSEVSPEGDLAEIGLCTVTPNFNLRQNQNLMFCVKGDIPKMGFPSAAAVGSSVPTDLQLNDLSVSLVIDRGANLAVDGLLQELPGCFSGTETASDCNVFAACLDVNLKFAMNNIICPGNKPGFQAEFQSLIPVFRDLGGVCSGERTPTTDTAVVTTASNPDTITEPIAMNAGVLSPPICGAGLDVGGFVTCTNAAILAIEADAKPEFRDFLAITCKLQ